MRRLFVTFLFCSSAFWCQAPPIDSAFNFLKTSLQDTNPERRRQAAAAIGAAGANPRAIQMLYDTMTSDKDPAVRQAATTSLGEMKARVAIPRLKAALETDPEIAFAAARSLWLMGDYSGRAVIEEVATDSQKNPTGLIAGAKLDASRKLHDRAGLEKMGAEEVAGALLGPFSIGLTLIRDLSKDGGAQGRLLAISLLQQQCDAASVAAFETAMENDKNEVVRAGAIKALGACGGSNEIPKLVDMVTSEKYPVQLAAAATIIKLSVKPDGTTASLKKK
jgi:HEAT repeat protein